MLVESIGRGISFRTAAIRKLSMAKWMRSRLPIPSSFELCLYCTILSKSHSRSPPPPTTTLLLLGLKAKGLGSLFIRLFFFPLPNSSPDVCRRLPRALAGTSPRYQHSSARLSRGGPFNSAQTDNLSAGYCHRRPCITVCQCCGGTEPFARVSLPHWRWCPPPLPPQPVAIVRSTFFSRLY